MNSQAGFAVLLLIVTLTSYSSAAPDISCSPTQLCAQQDVPLGWKVIDPEDCHKYYVCIASDDEDLRPSDESISCDKKQYFVPTDDVTKQGKCEKEGDDDPCVNKCGKYDCPAKCNPDTTSSVAYPNDCNKYLICIPGQDPLPVDCPKATPYFNGEKCVKDELCCDICTPFCETEFTEIEDPHDCTKYYLCTKAGISPTSEYLFDCGDNKGFDPNVGYCTEEASSCRTICNTTKYD